MKYLLDTHAIIWLLSEPKKFSLKGRKIIEDADNNLLVSAISFWEISLKVSVNKLSFKGLNHEVLPSACLKNGIDIIPLNYLDAVDYHQLPYVENHKDPFDRMLIWQAIKQGLILLTADKKFALYHQFGLQTDW